MFAVENVEAIPKQEAQIQSEPQARSTKNVDVSHLGPLTDIIEPEGEHTATVILLHGHNGHSSYWSPFHDALKESGAVWDGVRWLPLNAPMRKFPAQRSWFDYESLESVEAVDVAHVKKMRKVLHDIVLSEADLLASRGGVRRVILVGISQGGSMALDAALTLPVQDTVAGVVMLRSSIIRATVDDMSIGTECQPTNPIERLAVEVVNGGRDRFFHPSVVKSSFTAVEDKAEVKFTVIPFLDHNATYNKLEVSMAITFITQHLGIGPAQGINTEFLAAKLAEFPPWSRSWEELSSVERKLANQLGFSRSYHWDQKKHEVWETRWDHLLRYQQEAAKRLGYDQKSWDDIGF